MNYCSDCKHKYTMSQSPCTECRLFDKKEKGNPAVALLEKLKAEIMGIGNWREITEVPNGYVVECLNIVDNHIAELKGKKNETDN